MEVVGVVLAAIGILDQSIARVSSIRQRIRSAKDLGRSVIRAEHVLGAEKIFLDFCIRRWQKSWEQNRNPVILERQSKVLLQFLAEIVQGIEKADAILRKYDPDGCGDSQRGAVKVQSLKSLPKLLNRTISEDSANARSIQKCNGKSEKFEWSRRAQKDLDESLNEIKDARERFKLVFEALNFTSESNAEKEKGNSSFMKTVRAVRRAAASFKKTAMNARPTKDSVTLRLMLVEDRYLLSGHPAGILVQGKVFESSIKFPVSWHSKDSGPESTVMVVESLDRVDHKSGFRDLPIGAGLLDPNGPKSFEDAEFYFRAHVLSSKSSNTLDVFTLNQVLSSGSQTTSIREDFYAWKRLELSHLLALSVLHMCDTGWLDGCLNSFDLSFYGAEREIFSTSDAVVPVISSPSDAKYHQSRASLNSIRAILNDRLQEDPLQRHFGDSSFSRLVHDLGFVLLELGLGQPFSTFLDTPTASHCNLKQKLYGLVEQTTLGESYRGLLRKCLDLKFGAQREEEFYDRVVQELHRLKDGAKVYATDIAHERNRKDRQVLSSNESLGSDTNTGLLSQLQQSHQAIMSLVEQTKRLHCTDTHSSLVNSTQHQANRQSASFPPTGDISPIEKLKDFRPRSLNGPRLEGLPFQPPPGLDRPEKPDWHYIDRFGVIQGPFTTREMQQWYSAGFLNHELEIKRVGESKFQTLKQYALSSAALRECLFLRNSPVRAAHAYPDRLDPHDLNKSETPVNTPGERNRLRGASKFRHSPYALPTTSMQIASGSSTPLNPSKPKPLLEALVQKYDINSPEGRTEPYPHSPSISNTDLKRRRKVVKSGIYMDSESDDDRMAIGTLPLEGKGFGKRINKSSEEFASEALTIASPTYNKSSSIISSEPEAGSAGPEPVALYEPDYLNTPAFETGSQMQPYQGVARFVGPSPVELACNGCRVRHLKCDARTPQCSRCLTDNLECNYVKSRRGWKRRGRPRFGAAAGTDAEGPGPEPSDNHSQAGKRERQKIEDSEEARVHTPYVGSPSDTPMDVLDLLCDVGDRFVGKKVSDEAPNRSPSPVTQPPSKKIRTSQPISQTPLNIPPNLPRSFHLLPLELYLDLLSSSSRFMRTATSLQSLTKALSASSSTEDAPTSDAIRWISGAVSQVGELVYDVEDVVRNHEGAKRSLEQTKTSSTHPTARIKVDGDTDADMPDAASEPAVEVFKTYYHEAEVYQKQIRGMANELDGFVGAMETVADALGILCE